jgi:hypothetical protein
LAQSNEQQWAETAFFITVDEGGGYYDGGSIRALDLFEDGPRIPLIAISPFPKGGVRPAVRPSITLTNASQTAGAMLRSGFQSRMGCQEGHGVPCPQEEMTISCCAPGVRWTLTI